MSGLRLATLALAFLALVVSTGGAGSSYFSLEKQPDGAKQCGRRQLKNNHRVARIVGGSEAYVGQFPWIVSLRKKLGPDGPYKHYCAGVLITARHVLTAAHCVHSKGVEYWRVIIGRDTNNATIRVYNLRPEC